MALLQGIVSTVRRNKKDMHTWMDLEITILSEVSQKERDKYHMISLVCGI